MPRKDSGPERELRRALHERGLRYRLNLSTLPGRPDVVFTRARVAVFVDGCFWHSCPEHGVLPKNNRAWWRAKLNGNRERDERKDRELRAMGWLPVHVWEHDDPEVAADHIEKVWHQRLASP